MNITLFRREFCMFIYKQTSTYDWNMDCKQKRRIEYELLFCEDQSVASKPIDDTLFKGKTPADALNKDGGWDVLQSPYSFFLQSTLLFHSTILLYHLVSFSLTSLSHRCFLMFPYLWLILTMPSIPVLLLLVHAPFPYLFKTLVTACISLTWIYLVLSDTWL